ncbi:TPA: hypothetical protein NHR87_005905 [Pseudomonas aeruginosa]|uniref:hypothetical protein n=1 Tax=Pseudomonas aeruginosa TaxID=287 RepID=UPI0009371C07|nr:hypothetical protein [Pseudomonas aeruginosa]MBG4296154.1 hypothetical protein [Pseudomonas aeruginosa]RUJ53773.1 hypothetical protein IPC331_20085 [Pseudomonas aeruginosa]HBO0775562.1 hypothetical protein [Pseudomonas aeruginosa]HBO0793372.1 hypothetical protein [Pseudomonas aeruginosa]HBO3284694.1 hypothetical protein [Pseudomonas aeruginosa]
MSQQTLQDLLAERVSLYAASDRPRELIDEGIDKLFKEVVSDAFRSYGDFGGAIKEAVKAALPANVSDILDLQRYNAIVANALRQRWESAGLSAVILEQADKSIAEVLTGDGLLTGEVSLKALLEEFIEHHKECATEAQWERPEIRIEEGDGSYSHKTLHIYFDPEPEERYRSGVYSSSGRSNYSLKHAIHISIKGERETGDRWKPRVQFGEVYSAKLDDKKIAIEMQVYSKWERMLASLYFGNAILVIDCDPDDLSYGLYD